MTPGDLARVRRWKRSALEFVVECLGVQPDEWQRDVLEAVVVNQRIAMKACKGPGKSTVMAWIVWWFLTTRLHAKVVCTSITGSNLKDGLWSELAKWQKKSPLLLKLFQWNAERITMREHPETWFASARSWGADADKAQQANTLAGIHADNVMFVLDEVSDYPDGVVAAAEGALATGRETKLIVAGNPTRTSGPMYRIFTKDRALWWGIEITGDPDDPKCAPRVDKTWARQQIATWGRDSNFVRINVLGMFPLGQADTLISADVAGAASKRVVTEPDFMWSPKILGVDCARFGDDRSCLFPRQGRLAMQAKTFREIDLMQLTGNVVNYIEVWEPDAVFVDVTGLGSGVVDRLHELGYSQTFGIEFGGKALNAKKYCNKRTEMWADMAEWYPQGATPDDDELISEVTAPSFKFRSNGQMVLESKDDMKKRGLASPDKADALALTFAMPVALPDRNRKRGILHAKTEDDEVEHGNA
jgi:phage terminase large subunit